MGWFVNVANLPISVQKHFSGKKWLPGEWWVLDDGLFSRRHHVLCLPFFSFAALSAAPAHRARDHMRSTMRLVGEGLAGLKPQIDRLTCK